MSGVGPVKVVIQILDPPNSPNSADTDRARRAAVSLITGSPHLGKWINQLRDCIEGRPPVMVEVVPAPKDPDKRPPKLAEELAKERREFYASLSPARRAAAGLSHMPHALAPFGHVPIPEPEPEPEEPPSEDPPQEPHEYEYPVIHKPGRSLRTPPGAFFKKRK